MTREALHGGRVHEAGRALGVDPGDIVDFSANLNPLGPPEGVLNVFTGIRPSDLAAYPDSDAPALRRLLCLRHSAPPDTLVLGHGGAALLFLALRALAPRRVLVPEPCFREQPRAIAACGAERVSLPMKDLRLDLEALEAALPGCDAVLLTSPHNPTGQLVPHCQVHALAWRHPDVAFIVDEAFGDYAPGSSLVPGLLDRPRTVILQSLTKFHAMPAVRVGHAFADPDTARRMEALQEGWPIGQLDLLAAEAALQDHGYVRRTLEAFRADAVELRRALEDLGLEVLPSAGPFFLVRLPGPFGLELAARLRPLGLLVRTCADWPGLGDAYLRLAVRRSADQARLTRALALHLPDLIQTHCRSLHAPSAAARP